MMRRRPNTAPLFSLSKRGHADVPTCGCWPLHYHTLHYPSLCRVVYTRLPTAERKCDVGLSPLAHIVASSRCGRLFGNTLAAALCFSPGMKLDPPLNREAREIYNIRDKPSRGLVISAFPPSSLAFPEIGLGRWAVLCIVFVTT